MSEAIGYSRLSQESDTSIKRQKQNIRNYCEEKGLELVDILNDGQQSSGFDGDRPKYQQLIERVRAGEPDVVVLNDKRRIARDVDEVMRLVPDFREAGVELHTVRDGPLDLEDPLTAAIEIVSAAAAHEEKMEEIEKSIEAIREKEKRGDDLGRPRFGMTYDDSTPPRQVPGDNFDTVLKILRLESKGLSYQEISDVAGVSSSTAHRVVKRRQWYVSRSQEIESAETA